MRTGQHIKRARKRAGLTQVQLARRTGIEQATLSKIERNLQEPRLTTLRSLAKGLGIDGIDELINGPKAQMAEEGDE